MTKLSDRVGRLELLAKAPGAGLSVEAARAALLAAMERVTGLSREELAQLPPRGDYVQPTVRDLLRARLARRN